MPPPALFLIPPKDLKSKCPLVGSKATPAPKINALTFVQAFHSKSTLMPEIAYHTCVI